MVMDQMIALDSIPVAAGAPLAAQRFEAAEDSGVEA
jgi:hypothetical protein